MNSAKQFSFGLFIFFLIFVVGCGGDTNVWPEISDEKPAVINVPTYQPPKPVWKPPVGNFKKTIIVDAGHGGKDPGAGAVGYSKVPEKVIVLDVSKKITQILEQKGAKVVMSRTGDNFIELDDRAALAERYNADILVSIHADSCPKNYIEGATIYVAREATWRSQKVADSVVRSLKAAGIKCRGIREADFRVLVKHSKPSILVECGYLTNREDAARLNNSWYRSKIAKAIAEGIIQSF